MTTNTSVTLAETGLADAINDGGPYDSARNRMLALDFATQAQEMKAIGGQPDYALGSVHAVTRDGTLVIASAIPVSCSVIEVLVITEEPSGMRARTASRAASRLSTTSTLNPCSSSATTVAASVWSSGSAV